MPSSLAAWRRLALLLGAVGLLWAGGAHSARAAQAPDGFFGIVPQAPLARADYARIGRLHLSLRLPVRWYEIEPRRGEFSFAGLDEAIAQAAAQGIAVLPQVGGTPAWLSADPSRPPLSAAGLRAWRGFLRKLVGRYGPAGSFWDGKGVRLPVRSWQIWNEPNYPLFWRPGPSPRAYVKLLRASAAAVRGVDPDSKIVAAGLAPLEDQPPPWEFLRAMYRVPGARNAFDVAALHPYASTVRGLEEEVRQTRQVMSQAGDGAKPLMLTEVGVASDSPGPGGAAGGLRRQARFLTATFRRLASERRRWRIAGVYWFTWEDGTAPDPHCYFCEHAGLFDGQGRPKPSWRALRRLLGKLPAGSRVR